MKYLDKSKYKVNKDTPKFIKWQVCTDCTRNKLVAEESIKTGRCMTCREYN